MDDFSTIRIKRRTINKFKEYSKRTGPSYSETLDFMIAYFEDHDISPYDTPDKSGLRSLSNVLDKRMDAVASILRDIEKQQLKPTREMLESLFEGMDEAREPKYIERGLAEIEASKTQAEKHLDYYSKAYDSSQRELQSVKNELRNLLEKMSHVKSSFGKDHYRLDMPKEKMESIRSRLL